MSVQFKGRTGLVPFCKDIMARYLGTMGIIAILTSCVSLVTLIFPWGLKVIIDDVIPTSDIRKLWLIVGVLAFLCGFKFVLEMIKENLCCRTVEKITMDLRQEMCVSLIRLATNRIEQRTVGDCVSRVMSDTDAMKRFFTSAIGDLFSASMTFLIVCGILVMIEPVLTLYFSVLIPVFVLLQYRSMTKLKRQAYEVRERNGSASGYVGEVVQGMRVIKVFGLAGHVVERFGKLQRELFTSAVRANVTKNMLWLLSECLVMLGLIAVICVSALLIVRGTMTTGVFIAYYSYLAMVFDPVIRIISISTNYTDAVASLDRMQAFAAEEQDVAFDQHAGMRFMEKACNGKIVFDRVHFSYDGVVPILSDVSFTVEPGEHVALVGPSGAGKTTILNLLMRLYEPNSGGIYVDDIALNDINIDDYRRTIATVFQDDFIFSGTIRDAIACGREDMPMETVVKAAERAYAHTFISSLPKGYDTVVGERGVLLSGGERQRILIARALARDARILVLDEATSAVDAEVGILIQHAVREMIRGRTALIVAHHFLSVRDVDKVIVVDDGCVCAVGTHDELISSSSLYLRLFERQFNV